MAYFLTSFIFILGLIIGSFLNCLIWRLYKNETLGGRSYCPKCRKPITWYDNIPVVSFLALAGRCRQCHQPISWQYPAVELITASLFLLIFWKDSLLPFGNLLLVRDYLFAILMIIIFVYDWRWQLIPLTIVWPFTVIIFILNLFLGFGLWPLLFYGALGCLFFLVQYVITKKKGIGEGDIWLGLLFGLFFARPGELLLLVILTYGFGSIISLILLTNRKKGWKSPIALGPFLAFGAIITLIWGTPIINWYLSFF